MTENENEIEVEDAVVEAEEQARVTEEENEEDFFAESEVAGIPEIDPAKVITVRTSSGANTYVEVDGPIPLVDVIAKSGLRFNGDFTCWLNGAEVSLGTTVPAGSTVTVVGSVKGG